MKIHRLQNLDPGPLGPRLHAPDPLLHRGLDAISRLDLIAFSTLERTTEIKNGQGALENARLRFHLFANVTPEDGGRVAQPITRHQSTTDRDAPVEKQPWMHSEKIR